MTHLASIARLLPERDPHENIYEMVEAALNDFDDARHAAVQLARFELAMLAELGFGLDLSTCAATGATDDLIYVSPKSGSAVSRSAGEPWRDKLLRLPAFLRDDAGDRAEPLTDDDLRDGFALTGMFLLRHVLEPRGQTHSDARDGFIAAVLRRRASAVMSPERPDALCRDPLRPNQPINDDDGDGDGDDDGDGGVAA